MTEHQYERDPLTSSEDGVQTPDYKEGDIVRRLVGGQTARLLVKCGYRGWQVLPSRIDARFELWAEPYFELVEPPGPYWHGIYEVCDEGPIPSVSFDQLACAGIKCFEHKVNVWANADGLDPVQALDRAAKLFIDAHEFYVDQWDHYPPRDEHDQAFGNCVECDKPWPCPSAPPERVAMFPTSDD
jgi:hypothetical protein